MFMSLSATTQILSDTQEGELTALCQNWMKRLRWVIGNGSRYYKDSRNGNPDWLNVRKVCTDHSNFWTARIYDHR
jgi:hypothetical protein